MSGLLDKLLEDTIDPLTGESLGCYGTINTDQEAEQDNADECVYDLKPQSANSDIIVSFIDSVESGKLKLLEKKSANEFDVRDRNITQNKLPFINTDFLIEEVANLKIKVLSNGKYAIETVVKKLNKDRYSALAYILWYINKFEDIVYQPVEDDIFDYLIV